MNPITIALFIIIALAALVYLGMKQFSLNNMKKALNRQDYETAIKIADMKMSRKLLGDFVCDLHKIRAYYLAKDVENFDEMLDEMIHNYNYGEENKKEFLTTYYHTFLLKKNQKYADLLLEGIRETRDQSYILYNEQAYEVLFHKRSDLLEIMDKQIDSKKYYGFPLGVIVYYMAIQYLYLNDKEHALIYFKNALVCFHPKSIYVPVVKDYIKQLEDEIAEEKARIDESMTTY